MTELYPSFPSQADDLIGRMEKENKSQYASSCLFNFQTGDFAVDGTGAILRCDGVEAWKQWCMKTICTTRFACLAYSGEIGIDRRRMAELSSYGAICLELEKEITEALLADPAGRTYAVCDFNFQRQQDSILVNCRVLGKEGQQIEISVEV